MNADAGSQPTVLGRPGHLLYPAPRGPTWSPQRENQVCWRELTVGVGASKHPPVCSPPSKHPRTHPPAHSSDPVFRTPWCWDTTVSEQTRARVCGSRTLGGTWGVAAWGGPCRNRGRRGLPCGGRSERRGPGPRVVVSKGKAPAVWEGCGSGTRRPPEAPGLTESTAKLLSRPLVRERKTQREPWKAFPS